MLSELAVPAVIKLIEALTPQLSTALPEVVTSAVAVLTEYIPAVIAGYTALKPVVMDAIDALEANDTTTADEIKALRALVAADDSEFDAALAKSRSED